MQDTAKLGFVSYVSGNSFITTASDSEETWLEACSSQGVTRVRWTHSVQTRPVV